MRSVGLRQKWWTQPVKCAFKLRCDITKDPSDHQQLQLSKWTIQLAGGEPCQIIRYPKQMQMYAYYTYVVIYRNYFHEYKWTSVSVSSLAFTFVMYSYCMLICSLCIFFYRLTIILLITRKSIEDSTDLTLPAQCVLVFRSSSEVSFRCRTWGRFGNQCHTSFLQTHCTVTQMVIGQEDLWSIGTLWPGLQNCTGIPMLWQTTDELWMKSFKILLGVSSKNWRSTGLLLCFNYWK